MSNRIINSPVLMTYLSYIVTFGNVVFVLPLLLVKFANIELAVWFLFSTIMSMAMLADSGFSATLIRVISYFYSGAEVIPKNIGEFKRIKIESDTINSSKIENLFQTANVLYIGLGILFNNIIIDYGNFC